MRSTRALLRTFVALLASAAPLDVLHAARSTQLAAPAAGADHEKLSESRRGELVGADARGPSWSEPLEVALLRELAFGVGQPPDARQRRGRPGAWVVPSDGATHGPHSGRRVAVNEWGDLRMGIGFPAPADVEGLWIAGQAGPGVWPPAVRALGYREGSVVASTAWLAGPGAESRWLALGFERVDRIELEAQPALEGTAWYAIDDLAYARHGDARRIVIDFEDCTAKQRLTGSRYAGLEWESGSGFERAVEQQSVRAPFDSTSASTPATGAASGASGAGTTSLLGGTGTAPVLVFDFQGTRRFEDGNGSFPPDTCGAIGPDHFAMIVNRLFAVYDRVNGAKLAALGLSAFLPGADGDPRVLFDQHSGRWIVVATDFSSRVQLAVSLTDDAAGSWFKTSFIAAQGTDSGCTVDYPTLGVDANGVYVTAQMVPCGFTIFAIDKAPLLAATPSLGTITAFRNLDIEGALQPAHTWGAAPGEYVLSTATPSSIRVRIVQPPITAPTLVTLGFVSVTTVTPPPDVPALGSLTPLDMIGTRLLNAFYRDGSVWTTHTVRSNDRAAARWYEIDVSGPPALVQEGTVDDPQLHYFFPSVAANGAGDAVLAFSGSSAQQYAGAYFTGRLASDPLGQMAPPELYRAGTAPYNVLDPMGRNRWGDYSHTTLDPNDERTLWTVQEYAHATDTWGTWVGALEFGGTVICPDAQTYCVTSPNSVGPGAVITFSGSTSLSLDDLELQALGCPPSVPGIFFYGPDAIQLPFGDGLRCVGGSLFRLPPVQTDSFGDGLLTVDFQARPALGGPGALAVGSTWRFQFWYQDPAAGGSGFNLTDALELSFCP